MREEKLRAYLKGACAGRKYRVSGAELEQVLGINGTDLRKLVNRLRRKGIPVGSDRGGYFYAQAFHKLVVAGGYFYAVTAGEVYATIRQLKAMSSGLEAAIRGLEQALEYFGEREGEPYG